jgi:hypothetical protein
MAGIDTHQTDHNHPSTEVTEYTSGGANPAYLYTRYGWNQVDRGDCHQTGGLLILRSDGVGTFDAVVWTDHTVLGDVWHSSFAVNADDDKSLFTAGEFDSPSTHGAKVQMHAQFNFPPEKFSRLPKDPARVVQACSC